MNEALTIRHQGLEPKSMPEHELQGFVNAVMELLGTQQASVLTEIWLDELASLDAMPGPTSTEWRLVTLGAWGRLAHRLSDVFLFRDCP